METTIYTLSRRILVIIFLLLTNQAAFSASATNDSNAIAAQTATPTATGTDTTQRPASRDTTISKTYLINELTLSAGFVTEKNSPLRLNLTTQDEILKRATGITYPELLGYNPGIFATSESGSYGDARINIRGFKQENISVLLNGIPISGLVTGNMFWNNWLGLTDATHSIQLQKGIGASMLSDNSVGGTINIITSVPEPAASASAGFFITDGGQARVTLNFSPGELKGGWNFSLAGSYTWGPGYVERTEVNSGAYLFNVSKQINNRNTLLLTVLGSPETHEQRSVRLTSQEIDQYGTRYNKNWGYREGRPFNLSKNFYHKPYITLNHFYKSSRGAEITNTLYLSVGDGGGRWSESKGKRIIDFRKDGRIDWDAVTETNIPGEGSVNILSNYLAGHTQAGFRHHTDYHLNANTSLQAGAHIQYYSTWEKEQITDLLGGSYWYEDYANKSLAGLAGRNPVKGVGDYIRTHNGKIINHQTIYISVLHNTGRWNLRGGASLMHNSYRRWDKYNYVDNPSSSATGIYSGSASATGFGIKGGALFKPARNSSYYINAGVYSRLPYSDLFFSTGTNQIASNVKNEKNLLAEMGYRFVGDRISLELTGYVAYWINKTIMSDPYKQLDNITYRYMVQGLDALHRGVELTFTWNPCHWLSLDGGSSLGRWRWKNDVEANIYDEYSGVMVDQVKVYSNGLPVGDSPQTQIYASALFKIAKGLELDLRWSYNDHFYSDFDPTLRNNPDDRSSSYRLPKYNLLNAGIRWSKKWRKGESTLYLNVNNLLDELYIERAKDGYDHTLNSLTGYWGFGRNFSGGIRFSL